MVEEPLKRCETSAQNRIGFIWSLGARNTNQAAYDRRLRFACLGRARANHSAELVYYAEFSLCRRKQVVPAYLVFTDVYV